jgi:hypothetical protein
LLQITAILSGEITEIAEIQDFFLDSTFYRVNKFPVHKLLDPDFLSAFVKKGHFDARTLGTWGEVDQSIVVESGKLHLSVCKDVYQELGLSGQAEVISSKKCPAKYGNLFIHCKLFQFSNIVFGFRRHFC